MVYIKGVQFLNRGKIPKKMTKKARNALFGGLSGLLCPLFNF
jgi:hypothetical protein